MNPWSISIDAPSFSRPRMWKSMRRGPMLQPPGMAMVASPRRATSGPMTMMLARIVRTSS